MISRKFHALLDYLSAGVLIALPWIFGFSDVKAATYVAVLSGILVIFLSIVTDYEGGLIRILPMWKHLASDIVLGMFLAASPWLLGFNNVVYLPHVIMGFFAVASGLMTKKGSFNSAR